jgi:Family of unknown function (DUF6291)
MKGKKSFIAYSDWQGMFKVLPDDVAGKLIKHIFSYVNDENPSTEDYVINALFEQIKSTLKRDLTKWESQSKQRVKAGKRSAEVRKRNSTSVDERSVSSTDSVSVSVSVNDTVIEEKESTRIPFDTFWDLYDKKIDPSKCRPKWEKLTDAEQSAAMKFIPAYKDAEPDKKFRKNPQGFLTAKRWESEIIPAKPTKVIPIGLQTDPDEEVHKIDWDAIHNES